MQSDAASPGRLGRLFGEKQAKSAGDDPTAEGMSESGEAGTAGKPTLDLENSASAEKASQVVGSLLAIYKKRARLPAPCPVT